MPVPVFLNADDFAIAPGVSRAIAELLAAGRLSGTSCLAVSRFWPEHAPMLRPLAGRADIGLHFALTDFPPLGPMPGLAPDGRLPPLGKLLRLALLRRLDTGEIAAELDRQIDRFEAVFGRPPAFLDGHQHVHQLPGVRAAVIDRLRTRLPGAALRLCDEPLAPILRRGVAVPRALAVSALGRGLRRTAARHAIPVNRRFAGVRDFDETQPYAHLFARFVSGAPRGLVVMCHAGRADAELAAVDPVVAPRDAEYAYLAGPAFPDDLAAAGVRLGRLSEVCAQETSSAAD